MGHENRAPRIDVRLYSRRVRPTNLLPLLCVIVGASAAGCNDSKGYDEPGPRPQIVRVEGPSLAGTDARDSVACDPDVTGGSCDLPVTVYFRLPADQFVWKAYVRFETDGSDVGFDRAYLVERSFGLGDAEQSVAVAARVPPNILRVGALLRYSVRLVSGSGEESVPVTLPLSVQRPATAADGGDAGDAGP